jgi:XTP/dITP diphosphohydrolase
VVSLSEVTITPAAEDGATFAKNAWKKATHAAHVSGLPALADDSGLCVDALDGRPGVLSARYAEGSDADRVEKLLEELENVADDRRGAGFRCALCLALPDGREFEVEGECRGRISRVPRGKGGFGYDPIFLVEGGRSMAELSRKEKSSRSHRGLAFAKLKPYLALLAAKAL